MGNRVRDLHAGFLRSRELLTRGKESSIRCSCYTHTHTHAATPLHTHVWLCLRPPGSLGWTLNISPFFCRITAQTSSTWSLANPMVTFAWVHVNAHVPVLGGRCMSTCVPACMCMEATDQPLPPLLSIQTLRPRSTCFHLPLLDPPPPPPPPVHTTTLGPLFHRFRGSSSSLMLMLKATSPVLTEQSPQSHVFRSFCAHFAADDTEAGGAGLGFGTES